MTKSEKLTEYLALITRNTGKQYLLVNVEPSEQFANCLGMGSANLSVPTTDPIVLGLYSTNPCDIGNILLQCEKGNIAWRIFRDARDIHKLRHYFGEKYGAVSNSMSSTGKGEISRLTFKQEALEQLLQDPIFQIPKKEE